MEDSLLIVFEASAEHQEAAAHRDTHTHTHTHTHTTAVEFMDSFSMHLVENHLHLQNPISSHPFYTLIETSGSHDQHDKEVGVSRKPVDYRCCWQA